MAVKKKKEVELKFQAWVKHFGGKRKLAIELEVSDWTVYNWCRGGGHPEVSNIIRLIKLSQGSPFELNFDIIYKECTRDVAKIKLAKESKSASK